MATWTKFTSVMAEAEGFLKQYRQHAQEHGYSPTDSGRFNAAWDRLCERYGSRYTEVELRGIHVFMRAALRMVPRLRPPARTRERYGRRAA